MKKLLFITGLFLTLHATPLLAEPDYEKIQRLEEEVSRLTGENEVLKHNLELAEKEKVSLALAADKSNKPEVTSTAPKPKKEHDLNAVNSPMAMEDYDKAMEILQKGDYVKAEILFKKFQNNHPNSHLIVNAKYWLGETYFHQKYYGKAATEFGEAYASYSKADKKSVLKGPEILFKLSKSLHLLGKKDEAKVTLMQFDKEFKIVANNLRNEVDEFKKEIGA